MIFEADKAEEKLGYVFKDKGLLKLCFTHSSYANDHGENSNERLEFLGDAVLELVVTEYLYRRFNEREGKLTDLRRGLVSKEPLLAIVKKTGLCELTLLGNGLVNRANTEEKLFSSIYESVVGGIYLDGGITAAESFIKRTLIAEYEKAGGSVVSAQKVCADSKTALQEYVQKKRLGRVVYELTEQTGPAHAPTFKVIAKAGEAFTAEGTGKSKKAAESRAAATLLETLEKEEGNED